MKEKISSYLVLLVFLFLGAPSFGEPSQTPVKVPGPWIHSSPNAKLPLDSDWYAREQVKTADVWNGGHDGLSGLGSYQADFTGYFHVGLDRGWNQVPYGTTTIIAQSRGIFSNAEAAIAAKYLGQDPGRFLETAEKAGKFLTEKFMDKKYGGYYWSVAADGWVTDNQKQGYGQMHALLALSRLAAVSKDPFWSQEATRQFDFIQANLQDPDYPGAVLPGKDRILKNIRGNKNIDTFTHYFETLLSYGDIAPDNKKEDVCKATLAAGNLLASRLAVAPAGKPSLRFVAYNYADDWTISMVPYSRERQWSGALHASPGHAIELAFLLSRAVERAYPDSWLSTATALLDYSLAYAIDSKTGGMRHDTLDYKGKELPGNPDNQYYIYWAQGETLRALMHFSLVRNKAYRPAFLKAQEFVTQVLADKEHGDWYPEIIASTLKPSRGDKGDNWKGNYHEAMMMAEAIRLGGKK